MDTTNRRVSPDQLERFCVAAMTRYGMSPADAGLVAETLVGTDMLGIFTHGTKLLRGYIKRMKAGGLNPKGAPRVVSEGPGWAIVDGESAMGPLCARKGMAAAIKKARTAGIAYAGVKNSCHFGAAGAYALLAAEAGMIGLSMSNDVPSMTVPGARNHVLGTNPFAVAIPAGEEKPILLDVAMSTVAGSKVYAAVSQGKPIPDNWIITTADGRPTTDGSCYPHSASLLPMAGHKGYGLALMVETFAGLLSGGAIRGEIVSWIFEKFDQPTQHSHAFVAINVGAMAPMDLFTRRVDAMIRDIRNSPRAQGAERIYLPGEMEWEKRARHEKEGLTLPKDVWDSLDGLGQDAGLKLEDFFGQ